MRFSKFFVYVICTLAIGSSNMKASHGVLERAPTPVARPAASDVTFVRTVFYINGPQGGLIAENNLLSFEEQNADALDALEKIGFFKDYPERVFSGKDLRKITNLVYGTLQSKTNIATQLCMIPNELIRDFEGYVETVWNEDHPYRVQAFETLRNLQTFLEKLGKIINFGLEQWAE